VADFSFKFMDLASKSLTNRTLRAFCAINIRTYGADGQQSGLGALLAT